jgi:hypothetical protein
MKVVSNPAFLLARRLLWLLVPFLLLFCIVMHGNVGFVAVDCSCNVSLKKYKNLELVLDLVLEPS